MANQISELIKVKRTIYTNIARWSLEGNLVEKISELPETLQQDFALASYCCEHKEQAILKERIRVALGLLPGQVKKHSCLAEMAKVALSSGMHPTEEQPTIEMMEVACDKCPIDKYVVTDACRNCAAHHCQSSCPKQAIFISGNRAYIDGNRCVGCGLCVKSCSYRAIIEVTRPCEAACAVKAIKPSERQIASIDQDLCVSCGACITACPFGAVADYTQLVAVANALRRKDRPVYALVAPAFVGQFGPKVQPAALRTGLLSLGFTNVLEVGKGAEAVAAAEAAEFREKMAAGDDFMTSSCCPSFVALVNKHFPDLKPNVSHTPSPMAVIAQEVKDSDPSAYTVFLGPCVAKKGEAAGLPQVDAVLTFEELAALLVAAGINLAAVNAIGDLAEPVDPLARGFAKSGGVSKALMAALQLPAEQFAQANGLSEACGILRQAAKGQISASFIEGMACQGGCIGGPGTLINPKVCQSLLDRYCQTQQLPTSSKAAGMS